jgi:hypothetical protein
LEETNLNNITQINKAWEQWLAMDDWDVFATLNFGQLSLLEGDKTDAAGKLWRSCLSTIDRAIFGHTRKDKPRFNRVAFRHYGANGTNPHVHILVKSPIPACDFCTALNAIWATKFAPAASPSSNSIAPLITATGAIGYGQHEEFKNDTGAFENRLSYINLGFPHLVREDALQRLHAKATQANLVKARLALPNHIRISQENFDRRERTRVAALLRS